MTGIDGLVLQERDRRLLEALETMRIVDRDQAMAVAGFHSITRANTRLLKLKNAGLLQRLFVGTQAGNRKALYALSSKGAAIVGVRLWHLHRRNVDRLVVDPFIEHQLMVNTLQIRICSPSSPDDCRLLSWRVFQEPISTRFPIAPDGYFEIQHHETVHPMFLEVDRGTEGQRIWKKKIETYLRLAATGEFSKRFDRQRFRVLITANSERRLQSIRKSTARLTDKIFWFATFQSINNVGFWSAVWLRPKSDQKLALF